MAYLASIHKASSVRHAVKAHFLSPDEPSLIVAKHSRAEIYSFSGDGITLCTSFSVYGRITGLLKLRPANSRTDHLLIATDRYDYFTISWDAERETIRNERKAKDVADKFSRTARCGPLHISDPAGRMLGLHVYEGLFLAIPIITTSEKKTGKRKSVIEQIGNLDENTAIRMKELKVLDMAFLYGTENPVLAVLHKDGSPDATQLVTYEVVKSGGNCEMKDWRLKGSNLEANARMLIPVPDPIGGVLVVGEQTVTYFSEQDPPIKQPLSDSAIFQTWGSIDRQRFLLGDELGGLRMLFLRLDNEKNVIELKIESIGETSVADQLVYLDNGYVFVGSHYGDSQLVKLSPEDPKCQVAQVFSNLAPILDFQVLDGSTSGEQEQLNLYSAGQTRIVTGSGGFRDGGLRSMKSGVGLEDLAILGEMDDIRGLYVLQSDPENEFDDTLVVSFIDETRIFHFDAEGEVEELDAFKGLSTDEETIAAHNLPGGRILQVTGFAARLIDAEGGAVVAEIRPTAKITAVSVTDEYVVSSEGGKTIVVYDASQDLKEVQRRSFDHEIACLFAAKDPKLCAIGFWTSSTVSLFQLPNLNLITEETLEDGKNELAIPRSILLANILDDQYPSLLVGMGDGRMYTFALDKRNCSLSRKKVVALGTQAFYFHTIPRSRGTVSVFAACDHPSLIYGDDGRLAYSTVTADNVTQLCSFNVAAFPSSVVVLVGGELKISTVDTARNIHIKTLNIGDVVRRVSFSKQHKLFGIVTVHSDLDSESGVEVIHSFMRIIDEASFKELDSYALNENELVESIFCASLDNGDGTFSDKFLVGTGYQDADVDDSVKGRILVIELTEQRRIKLATELRVRSAVKCLEMVGDKIVAAMNKTVDVFSFAYPSSLTRPKLNKVASYRAHSEPIDLSVFGTTIAVADVMKGPSLLQYITSDEGKPKLEQLCRIYQPSWATAVEMWDKDTVVSSDTDGNISIWKRSTSAIEEDQRRLQAIAEIRVGEMVNRIRRIDAHVPPDSPILPKAYCATVDGSIYLLGAISEAYTTLLLQLQANLAKVIKGIGDLDFQRYRAFSTPTRVAEEPFRFVDGDFIERFLELPEDVAGSVVQGAGKESDALNIGVEELKGVVEGLKRLH